MPAVRRMGEKLFGTSFYEGNFEPQPELLSTIRVPKNLLYLTDRLPKPHYDKVTAKNNRSRDRNEEIDDLKRRTHEPRNDSLPELPIKKKASKLVRAGDSSVQISQSTRVNPAD
jgi:hypothetical protein